MTIYSHDGSAKKRLIIPSLSSGWTPLISFRALKVNGKTYRPRFDDRLALLLLKRVMPKRVSFLRAYTGWRHSGAKEEHELGEGRAFYRWLIKHELSIIWKEEDFSVNHFFISPEAPKHDPDDELARDHSFCIKPVCVENRNVKLYVEDKDMLSLLYLPYGNEQDFLELVSMYISARFERETWRAPSPSFAEWVMAKGAKPIFEEGQLGFTSPVIFGTPEY